MHGGRKGFPYAILTVHRGGSRMISEGFDLIKLPYLLYITYIFHIKSESAIQN